LGLLQAESTKFDNIAKTAAEAGKTDDVRDAVKLKQKADGEVAELTAQIALNNTQAERLRELLNEGQQKLEKAKSDITVLAARLDGAHLREDMAKAESDFAGDGGMSSISDLRKMVEHQEDVADAQVSLSVTPEASVEKRLEDTYMNPQTLDAEVAKYMTAAPKAPKK
jgi:phage shock protein A